jgi:rhodanese-related sulfurtransferase
VDLALDALKTATLLVEEPGTIVIDLRPADAFAGYHLPGAVSLPGAGAQEFRTAIGDAPAAVVYADKDDVAQKLVAEARAAEPSARVHYLAGGARTWYVAFQLPVPLFAGSAPPPGWTESMAAVKGWFGGDRSASERAKVLGALQTLAKASYQPDLLQGAKKPAAAGAGKKKLSGGCG